MRDMKKWKWIKYLAYVGLFYNIISYSRTNIINKRTIIEKELIEFLSQCPEHKTIGQFWFPFTYVGYCERIKVLENCIKQCKNKINETKKSIGNFDPLVDRNHGSRPGE